MSRGQRLHKTPLRSWGMSRTCLDIVRAATEFWTHSLNHLAMYYHAQLNPDILALKLFCQHSKPGFWTEKLDCGRCEGHGHQELQLSSPWDLPLNSFASDANLWLLSWKQWKLLLHWMKYLHFWCHIQATTRPIFINLDLVVMLTVTQKYKGCALLGAGSVGEVQF